MMQRKRQTFYQNLHRLTPVMIEVLTKKIEEEELRFFLMAMSVCPYRKRLWRIVDENGEKEL